MLYFLFVFPRTKEDNKLKKYEAVCVFYPKTDEKKTDEIISKIDKKIKDFGGKPEKIDKWGIKRLASPFQKHKNVEDGYYVVIHFNGERDLPNKVSSQLRLIEELMRYSVILSKGEEGEKVEVELPGAEKLESPQS